MELRHLRYFIVLAQELHFRRAAEKLFIAQPALSRQVQELEKELGAQLFERTKRRVALTPAGNYLHEQARRLLAELTEVTHELRRLQSGEIGTVQVGYVGTAMNSVLPGLLQQLKQAYPRLMVALREQTTAEQLQAVRAGQLHLGFVRLPVAAPPGVTVRVVWREPFALVLPAAHPRAAQPLHELASLADEPFVFFPRGRSAGYYDQIMGFCHRAGLAPRVECEAVGSAAIVQLVASGLGLSILPLSAQVYATPAVCFIALDFIAEFTELGLIYQEARLPMVLRQIVAGEEALVANS